MAIRLLAPPSAGVRNGNVVTVERWRSLLLGLGHAVADGGAPPERVDVLIAFHAHKSREGILEAVRSGRAGRLIICLTGTDLYEDLKRGPEAAGLQPVHGASSSGACLIERARLA